VTVDGAERETAYVVEQYLPNDAAGKAEAFVAALLAPSGVEGVAVGLACSLLLPDDDLCLYVLKAASPEAAARAAERAAITPERVITAIVWLAS
jgi:hypothetical protein